MENIFDTLNDGLFDEAISPRSVEARTWLEEKVASIAGKSVNRAQLMRSEPLKATPNPLPGRMYMFYYNPENKDKLPYYDRFPLLILVDKNQNGFEGLNLHYLPVDLRQKLFYGLLSKTNNQSFNRNTYMKVTYQYLKSTRKVKAYRPCYKRYLTNNVKGLIANVPANEWENAVHLPTAMFKKASQSKVHADSRKMIQRF
jgi:hypothetical protein